MKRISFLVSNDGAALNILEAILSHFGDVSSLTVEPVMEALPPPRSSYSNGPRPPQTRYVRDSQQRAVKEALREMFAAGKVLGDFELLGLARKLRIERKAVRNALHSLKSRGEVETMPDQTDMRNGFLYRAVQTQKDRPEDGPSASV